jgi:hypothetical protein
MIERALYGRKEEPNSTVSIAGRGDRERQRRERRELEFLIPKKRRRRFQSCFEFGLMLDDTLRACLVSNFPRRRNRDV